VKAKVFPLGLPKLLRTRKRDSPHHGKLTEKGEDHKGKLIQSSKAPVTGTNLGSLVGPSLIETQEESAHRSRPVNPRKKAIR